MHNAHMYYFLLDSLESRTVLIDRLKKQGVNTVFHYVPLHSSPAGQKYGRVHGEMTYTNTLSERLLRLPLWVGLNKEKQQIVIDSIIDALK